MLISIFVAGFMFFQLTGNAVHMRAIITCARLSVALRVFVPLTFDAHKIFFQMIDNNHHPLLVSILYVLLSRLKRSTQKNQ